MSDAKNIPQYANNASSAEKKYCATKREKVDLRGKRVLFIAADFFKIPARISRHLEKSGAEVDYFDERPANDFATKALIRINPSIIGKRLERYYRDIARKTAHRDYDYVFFIKAECISKNSLEYFRSLHRRARFILYLWDPAVDTKQFGSISRCFDKILSFDTDDCATLGLDFLPMFYTPEFDAVPPAPVDGYKLMFVGTIHDSRYRFIESIARQVREHGGRVFSYPYIPHRLVYLRLKYLSKHLRDTHIDDFKFTPLSHQKLIELYSQSEITVDMPKPGQKGLTPRSIDALGANRKLITTNTTIADYDFYDPQNILIVDPEKPVVPTTFLDMPYRMPDAAIKAAYGIDNWIATIFA